MKNKQTNKQQQNKVGLCYSWINMQWRYSIPVYYEALRKSLRRKRQNTTATTTPDTDNDVLSVVISGSFFLSISLCIYFLCLIFIVILYIKFHVSIHQFIYLSFMSPFIVILYIKSHPLTGVNAFAKATKHNCLLHWIRLLLGSSSTSGYWVH